MKFLVTINVINLSVAIDDDPPIVGFYTWRVVNAGAESAAVNKAIEMLRSEEKYCRLVDASEEAGVSPPIAQIDVTQVTPLSWWRGWWPRKLPGYIFYSEDEEETGV